MPGQNIGNNFPLGEFLGIAEPGIGWTGGRERKQFSITHVDNAFFNDTLLKLCGRTRAIEYDAFNARLLLKEIPEVIDFNGAFING